jgi:hypothetical protein
LVTVLGGTVEDVEALGSRPEAVLVRLLVGVRDVGDSVAVRRGADGDAAEGYAGLVGQGLGAVGDGVVHEQLGVLALALRGHREAGDEQRLRAQPGHRVDGDQRGLGDTDFLDGALCYVEHGQLGALPVPAMQAMRFPSGE